VKTMKKLNAILVGLLCSLMAAGNAGAVTATATVTATVTSVSSITVGTPIDFGSIAATATQYRFKSPSANVSYFPAGSFEIRVYTDNGVGTVTTSTDPLVRGYIRNASTGKMYLKIWCPNFNSNKLLPDGTGGVVPALSTTTSQTDYLWKGYNLGGTGYDAANPRNVTFTSNISEATYGQDLNGNGNATDTITATAGNPVVINEGASLSYVREQETFYGISGREDDTTLNAQTWRCALTWNTPGRGDGSLGSPFPVFFATDLMGVAAGSYSSANNTGGTSTAGVFFDMKIY
jgi:hypothetical protein